MQRKKLGVVAGMGPYAATFFLNRLLQFTPAKKEWEYFRILADYNVFIPSRTRALLYGETSPKYELIRTINNLQKMGADFIAVPCNSGHGWYDEVASNISVPWINLIESTSDTVKEQGIDSALIISAYVPKKLKLYDKYIKTKYLNNEDQQEVYKLIERLKLDENRLSIKYKLYNIVEKYDADGIVIACTEPSMLFDSNEKSFGKFKLVDSTSEYAKKCVKLCMGKSI